ncbi:MAG: selenocysteine-specific translation elongation factor [Oscillospiraceae bacterium]|nr:selenocysteine-specific translation elongation factor [Oscillospiraceae bacterium]MBR3949586.1 selenocysteine-specific translation elongation factor [Oscillospiraceae bacterium]
MKHVIIGTAGHVDHGKTLLIKALTGIDTDRLIEEKKRGITIELGFAHLDWPDGTQAGIVDVPGHEKFIKNMLTGAGGIDLAMLVIAADDGVMPQTVEHLDILTLLGIKDGLVVITKADMVDPEWLELMQEEIAGKVAGTFLEGKPIHTVSAYTGQGIPELREMLRQLVQKAEEKSLRIPFRLPVDRVFSVEGFGTVVTGTLIEGAIHEGDLAELVPSGIQTRIRNLQVHGKTVPTAYAGQRVAINLTNVKKTDIRRGDAVAKPGSVRVSRMLDVRLQNLKDSGRIIKHDSQVHLFHGAAELLAKVVLFGQEELKPGESCYAQLRLTEPIASKNGDRFVIRFFSPLETIGGGVILDDQPRRHKRSDSTIQNVLQIKESGSRDDLTVQLIREFGTKLPTASQLVAKLQREEADIAQELDQLCSQGHALQPLPGRYAAATTIDKVWKDCEAILLLYHKQNPLHAGIKSAELRQKLFKGMDQACADALINVLRQEGKLRKTADSYALSDFTVTLTKRQRNIRDRLLKIYTTSGIETPITDHIMEQFPTNERTDFKQVLESLLSSGELVMLIPQICLHKDTYADIVEAAKKHFETQDSLTLAQLRDLLNTSRKYSQAIIEYFDKLHITRKDGDVHYLDQGF